MDCPICFKKVVVRENKRKKPYIRCDHCGILLFANKPFAIKKLREAAKAENPHKDESWF